MVAKRGEIMPAPLHCALRRTGPASSATSSEARFSKASVVSIARWKSPSPSRRSSPLACSIPASTRSSGRWWLIPPVEASAACSGRTPSAPAAAS